MIISKDDPTFIQVKNSPKQIQRELNITKAIDDKSTANLILNREKLKVWSETRMPTITNFIQHSFVSPSHDNQTNKRNEMCPNTDYMTLYIENPKDSIQKFSN